MVVTDKRLLIREGEDIKIFTADMLSTMQICMNRNGTGTVLLVGSNSNSRGYRHNYVCSLQNLADVSQAQSADYHDVLQCKCIIKEKPTTCRPLFEQRFISLCFFISVHLAHGVLTL